MPESKPEQLALYPGIPVEPSKMARAGIFSGERLKAKSPETYSAAMAMLGQGAPIRTIANELKISVNTVLAIKSSEANFIETEKKELAAKMMALASVGVDRLIDKVEDLPIGQLPLLTAIMIDKAVLLNGDATHVIEHREAPKGAAIVDLIKSLPSSDVLDAEVKILEPNGFGNGAGAEQKGSGEDPGVSGEQNFKDESSDPNGCSDGGTDEKTQDKC